MTHEHHIPRDDALRMVGRGWHHLIHAVYDVQEALGGQVVTVKEKFGRLRIYTEGGPLALDLVVIGAEQESGTRCEVCGDWGTARTLGWIKTLCDLHHQEREASRAGPETGTAGVQ